MKANFTDIIVILDRSGSMETIKNDVEGGFDAFVTKQKEVEGDCVVSLVQFDNEFETVYSAKPLKDVPKLDLVPRGGTALFDAVGRTVNETGVRLAAMKEEDRPSQVSILIITDGQENSSREFNSKKLTEMIGVQKTQFSWSFSFIGADETALAVADSIGIGAANSIYFQTTDIGTSALFNTISDGMGAYRRKGTATTSGLISQDSYNAHLDAETTTESKSV